MKQILAIIIASAFATPSFATLSGFSDTAVKIDAIFANQAIGNELRQAPVGSISEIGKDKDGASLWLLRTQECDLTVRVIEVPPGGFRDNSSEQEEPMVGMSTYLTELKNKCE